MKTKLNKVENWEELAQAANWSVSQLAMVCGVSTRTLERHFREKYRERPKRWLLDVRQKQAMNLIGNDLSVKETSLQLGYRHPSTFSREFKKYWGTYPSSQATKPE